MIVPVELAVSCPTEWAVIPDGRPGKDLLLVVLAVVVAVGVLEQLRADAAAAAPAAPELRDYVLQFGAQPLRARRGAGRQPPTELPHSNSRIGATDFHTKASPRMPLALAQSFYAFACAGTYPLPIGQSQHRALGAGEGFPGR